MKAEKILFTGKVVDNEDPYVLNRIRVFPDTDENIEKILKSQFSDAELERGQYGLDIIDTLKYSKRDPYIFYPLLSFSLSIIPKLGEMVWVTYSNPNNNNGRKEQFYVPTMSSNPFNSEEESYEQQIINTTRGFNLNLPPKLKADSIDDTGRKPYNQPVSGLFALPGDNAFYGRGSTDIILKPDEIIMRAGKISGLQPNKINKVNEKRAFLQMSYFQTEKTSAEPEVVNTKEIDNTPLKKLIEYDLINSDNTANAFTGTIYMYDLPPDEKLANDTFTSETQVPNNVTTSVWSYNFLGKPMDEVASIINDVINSLNNGGEDLKTKYPNEVEFTNLYNSIKNWESSNRIFPYFYRASQNLRDILNTPPDLQSDPTSFVKISNCSNLISRVKFSFALGDFNGDGLVSQKNKFGVTTKSIKKQKQESENTLSKNSISVLGSSKIILLSNTSTVPGKKPVNLNNKTIYGLTQTEIQDNIIPNTDSTVRGEKLKEILNLIVQFLNSHCHAYHGLPPVPVSHSGVSVPQIESEFQLYDSKVLNQNIRIN